MQVVSSTSGQQTEQEEAQAVTVSSVQTKRAKRRGAKVEETVTMDTIRVRVLRLLGRVGGRHNLKVRRLQRFEARGVEEVIGMCDGRWPMRGPYQSAPF